MKTFFLACLFLGSVAGNSPAHDYLFEGDFETEDLVFWIAAERGQSEAGVSDDLCRSGFFSGYSYVDPESSYNSSMAYFYRAFATNNEDFFQVYFYLGNDFVLDTNDEINFVTIGSSTGGAQVRIYLLKTGPGNYVINSSRGGTGTKIINSEKWYGIEIRYKEGAGNGELDLWVDDDKDISATGLTLGSIGRISLGFRWKTGDGRGGTVYYDDAVIDDAFIPFSSSKVRARSSTGFCRTALRIDAVLAGYESTDKLVAILSGQNVYEKSGCLKGREVIKLDMLNIDKGLHTITVKLLTSSDVEKASDTVDFEKQTSAGSGVPTVSIDGDNNLLYKGEKIFPVTPFMVNEPYIGSVWVTPGRVNQMGWVSGYATEYTTAQYREYLDECENNGALMIGPGRRYHNYKLGPPRQASLPDIIDYVTTLKSHNSIFMWSWVDEPNLGGANPYHFAAEVKDWTDACHAIDTDHPVIINFGGLHPEMTLANGYLDNIADVYGFDLYPVAYSYVDMNQWTDTILKHLNYTYKLAPWFSFVEVTDIEPSDPEPCPTPEQIKMEAWINVVCGVKGISWFHDFAEPPIESYNEMAKFVVDVQLLKGAILSSDSDVFTVSDDANVAGNRVEAMIKEYEGDLYLFAARVTEPLETGNITVNFDITGVTDITASVYDEGRTVNVVGGKFADLFEPCAVHIYRLSSLQPPENLNVEH